MDLTEFMRHNLPKFNGSSNQDVVY